MSEYYKASGKSKNNKFRNWLLDCGYYMNHLTPETMPKQAIIFSNVAESILKFILCLILATLFAPVLGLFGFISKTIKKAWK